MTSRLAHARHHVAEAERQLDQQREAMRALALDELRRGVSASRIARELGMSRAAVSNWARSAGLSLDRQAYAEPRELDE